MQAIFAKLKKAGCPSIAYVNGGGHLIEPLLDCGSNGVSIDWRTPLSAVKDLAQATKRELPVVQGNFDPTDLFLDPPAVHTKTRAMVAKWTSKRGYIVNLGHGVLVETPRASVIEFVRAAQEGWSNHG